MGIEPTPDRLMQPGNGFEDREGHQAPCASVSILTGHGCAGTFCKGTRMGSPVRLSTTEA